MRGIITFTTDFGLHDPYVAVMKGQALRRHRDLQLIDITHDIAPYQPAEAGFWLERVLRYFPAGTVHVAIVDPGVGTARELIAVAADGQQFLAPDNGLLAGVARRSGAIARRIAESTLAAVDATPRGATFHGRDLLAPLAAELACGRLVFETLGEVCVPASLGGSTRVCCSPGGLVGTVLTVDRFGNLFSNLESEQIDGSRAWAVSIRDRRLKTVGAYGEGAPGELVALVNSWGLVEIAEVAGDASRRLGVGRGEPVTLVYSAPG